MATKIKVDYDRELLAGIELIEETGQAQAAEIAQSSNGKKTTAGFWRVEPASRTVRAAGTIFIVHTPDGNTFRQRWPKNGCTAETLKAFREAASRYRFDFDQAEKDRLARLREATRRQEAEAAERERALHEEQRGRQAAKAPATRRKKKKYTHEEIVNCDVSPSYAQALLDDPGDKSRRPRPLSESNIRRFVDIIEGNRWNPDFMYIDWFGQVINGRHRLTAIARGDKTVACKLIFGVDPDLFLVTDTARNRTGGDTLYVEKLAGIDGVRDWDRMASALRLLNSYKSGAPTQSWGHQRVDNDVLVGLAHQYPLIHTAMEMAVALHQGRKQGRARFQPSSAIVFCYLALEAWPDCGEKMDSFQVSTTLGTNVGETDPRKALYDLMLSQNSTKRGDVKINAIKQLALLLKMWNAYCTGRPVRTATWRTDESMPVPVTETEVMNA